jgi:hypothetical protein
MEVNTQKKIIYNSKKTDIVVYGEISVNKCNIVNSVLSAFLTRNIYLAFVSGFRLAFYDARDFGMSLSQYICGIAEAFSYLRNGWGFSCGDIKKLIDYVVWKKWLLLDSKNKLASDQIGKKDFDSVYSSIVNELNCADNQKINKISEITGNPIHIPLNEIKDSITKAINNDFGLVIENFENYDKYAQNSSV